MAGRGPMSFQKRQKELKRKEKREEKLARKVDRKGGNDGNGPEMGSPVNFMDEPLDPALLARILPDGGEVMAMDDED
jgi:hypothetical protein